MDLIAQLDSELLRGYRMLFGKMTLNSLLGLVLRWNRKKMQQKLSKKCAL